MDGHLKILMLEDNESDAGLVQRALQKSDIIHEVFRVDTKEDFIGALNEYIPDVILSDHSLPQFNSTDAYGIYKKRNLKMPFILVTGTVSEEFAVTCLHDGIDDYILKDNLTRLPAAIKNALKKKALELEQITNTEKLRIKNDELSKTNKELDRFVYSASHELRGPLASAVGLTALVYNQIKEGQYNLFHEYLQMMDVSLAKLNTIVDEIASYSKNNRAELRRELIDIDGLLGTIFEKLAHLKNINKVEKRIDVEQLSPWYGDNERLLAVFENLISNAIIYQNEDIEDRYVSIQVKILEEKVFLNIQDNGVGIEGRYIDKIFDMFYRASILSQGSGLGLYIVKETLGKLNGKITVESKIGKGTIFSVELENFEPYI